ncbi:hypothetical protein CKM354_001059600 [Cercospora kikuchii]|uniref:Uncharacterized protein n=1 Tax=Cercospora kikuchii TaxID=84275 RepID=A0A9P3FJU0_9PEZI|nr:uncharacterized protein CKM354_001059600 [Cercospora kikuchii]GIZ47507.1 hypothetical protein CKM354_001059600 [Cercospora kikuchii]
MEEIIGKFVTRVQQCEKHIKLVLEDLSNIKLQHDELLGQHKVALQSTEEELADQRPATGEETAAKDEPKKEANSQEEKIKQLPNGRSIQKKVDRSQRENIEQLDKKDGDQENEIQRLADTVASDEESIAQLKDEVKKEKQNAKPAPAVQDVKIECLKNNLADQKRATEKEGTTKNGAIEGASTHRTRDEPLKKTRKKQNEKTEGPNETTTGKKESVPRSKDALEQEKESVTAAQQDARQAQQRGTPPPSTPQTSKSFNVELRQARLLSLNLTSTAGSSISPSLQQALVHSDKQSASCLLAANAQVGAPALHMAALFGDVELAKFLIARGAAVNEPCDAQSEKPGRSVHGVTPMHLAFATQNEEMIRYLHHTGGKFTRPHFRHQRTTAPPLWLVSSRWLNMFGEDAAKVVGVLKLLKYLGWNTEDKLNKNHENMRTIVQRELKGRPVLQKAVLAEL